MSDIDPEALPNWYHPPEGAVEDEAAAINALRTAYEDGHGWLSTLVWNRRNEYLTNITAEGTSLRMVVEGFLAELASVRAEAEAALVEARARIAALERWKAEAIGVLHSWDDVYEVAGAPGRLGEDKAKAVAAALVEARARIEALETEMTLAHALLADSHTFVANEARALLRAALDGETEGDRQHGRCARCGLLRRVALLNEDDARKEADRD